MKAELERRASATDQVWALFRQRPMVWISWQEIAHVGGSCAWRTRVADARKLAKRGDGDIVWNGQVKASAYMYRPYQPLARDAAMPTQQPRLGGW